MASKEDKAAKREARQLWEEARQAHAMGDYRRMRELDVRVLKLSPDSDHGRQAARELDGMRLDRYVLYAGIGALVLYILGWIVGLV